ncbi:MAG TPA: NADPH-dependent 7-cyano-7-deazaguanine reductase QueF, partial [Cycloclasticus sp.]|nr:NADPH-dependent 7-cyano-7-deazaguanine reductase QueF [Cycloclasticus sp.]
FMRLSAEFNVRGGVYTTVVAEHKASDWQPSIPVQLP